MRVFGAQGGMHFEFRIRARGRGLRNCISVRYDIHEPEVPASLGPPFGLASVVDDTELISTPVIDFDGPLGLTPEMLTVETLGRTIALLVTANGPVTDAGADGSVDASMDADLDGAADPELDAAR